MNTYKVYFNLTKTELTTRNIIVVAENINKAKEEARKQCKKLYTRCKIIITYVEMIG